ncbi:recombinase family protein [Hyphomicrobium facile]|uniref:Site-specific DNA recombinase n=1 Tax=Hyphomicrobium facile TaxID=51670 RepID=A0A1I7NH43_9HYPH|nr:recombinase family protein [Hyphomicrobium facile]SFV33985.1 Site-specific DNA recombinase [Hyphomicrobium facile]
MIRKLTANAPVGQLIGYARVSTDGQDFASQVDRLRAAGCTKVYSEKQSGTKRDREQLQAAIEYVREGDTFVCIKADRIARSTKDFLDIIDKLNAKGVALRVLDQPELSGEGATAQMLRTILAAVSEFELSLIRDRMSEGRKRAKASGAVFGRPKKIDAKAAKTVKMLKKDEKLSVPEISIRTGLSVASVYRALRA